MKHTLFFIIVLMPFLIFSHGVSACTIESGPPEELVEYMTRTRTELSQIRSQAGSASKCDGRTGSLTSERQFIETLKRLDEPFAGWGSVFTNFVYSIPTVANGDSRGPVSTHGKLWKDIDKQAGQILQSISSICALSAPLSSGRTPTSRISSIITANRTLEAYYWQVSLGESYNTPPENMEKYAPLIASIQKNYNFETTKTCKGNESSDKIEAAIKRLMDSAGASGKGNEKSNQSWKDAIALFAGNDTGTAKYIDVERRVLGAELARQGLSTNAKTAILDRLGNSKKATNFDIFNCLASRTDDKSTPEDISKAQRGCDYNLVTGLDTLTSIFKNPFASKTTDEYLARTMNYERARSRISTDMKSVWTTLTNSLETVDQPTNEKIMNDLVNTHLKLVTINNALKKEIPKAYKNCEKGSKDVECPRP